VASCSAAGGGALPVLTVSQVNVLPANPAYFGAYGALVQLSEPAQLVNREVRIGDPPALVIRRVEACWCATGCVIEKQLDAALIDAHHHAREM